MGDALDFRHEDSSLTRQLSEECVTRELNKSLAAFTPFDPSLPLEFPVIATGNWGGGAFGGCVPLKALIQWASASQCGRKLRYFPFDDEFWPDLQSLQEGLVRAQVEVGDLLRVLWALNPRSIDESTLLKTISKKFHLAKPA